MCLAVPLRSGSASEVADAMMNIFSKVGFPMKVMSDRGKVFLSKVVKQLYEQCGIDCISTSPYRPQSNGVVERLHGTLKPMLAKAVNSGIDCVQYLPMALSAIRMVPNRDTGLSPMVGNSMVPSMCCTLAGWRRGTLQQMCVLECISSAGMTVKRKKSVFGRKRLKYLGHMVGEETVTVPENRVLAFKEYGKPKTKRQLRTFLGALGYYRRFIPGFARSAAILTPSTALSAPKLVDWSEEMSEAFTILCESLSCNVVLFVPTPSDRFIAYTDASGAGVGACLHADREDGEVPISFYSRQLRGAEKNYSVTELESLAIVSAINHYDRYLYSQTFYSGNRPRTLYIPII